jgi:hypothetical protein
MLLLLNGSETKVLCFKLFLKELIALEAVQLLFLKIIHHPVLFKTQHFGGWILYPSSCGTYSVGPNAPEGENKIQSSKCCVF